MTPDESRWYWNPENIVRVQEFFGSTWELPFRLVTYLGDSGLILIMVAATFWVLGRHVTYATLATVMIGAALGSAIKVLTDVPRPAHPDLILYESGTSPSFPSGHTFLAISFWGSLVFLGVIRTMVAVVIVLLVMISRLFLGVHYLADMFVGLALGLLAVTIGYGFVKLVLERLTQEQAAMLMGAGLFGSLIMLPVTGDFPLGWEILGGLLGAGVGTVIESRWIKFAPSPGSWSDQTIRVAIGAGGIVMFVLLGSLLRDLGGPAIIRAILFSGAGLWAMLATPYLLDRLGHNAANHSSQTSSTSTATQH
ncbi:MAG: phosphatase PAP2 family protein [Sphaerobacteraceae bacterium]|nr:MAG: phosphatase PAP2 family protein [Sphaerobacteraceae bacterium]